MSQTLISKPSRTLPWKKPLVWLILGLGSLVMIGPFYWTAITSLKSKAEIMLFPPTFWPREFTADNWIGLMNLGFGSFPVFFRNSVFVAGVVTLLILLTSSMAGYVFAKFDFRGRSLLFWLTLSMMMIPSSVTLIPLYGMMVAFKWTNSYWALIVPVIFSPFGIFLMRQAMHNIPNELIDAARIDGASEFGIFFKIILPLSTSALAALAIFTFVAQWDSFMWPLVIINDSDLYTLPLGLAQFRGRVGIDMGGVTAGSMVAVVPVLIIYFIAQKRFVEGIALTGLKG
jgi:ABC-type glycerol-3-phosphate transport system permease component